MSRVFLHIGMHKTGSTAIQSAFAGYETSRTRYADLGYENHSIPFYTAYSDRYLKYHIWRSAGLRPEEIEAQRSLCRARIEAEVAGAGKRDLIFSGEDISRLPRAGVEELYSLLMRYDCDTQVIIYVREPMSFVQSALQQVIRDGKINTEFLAPRYREKIEKYIDIFGRRKVVIRVFDRLNLYENDIIKDFSRLIGVEAPPKGKDDNTSLSTEAIKIIYLLNQLIPSFGERTDLIQCRKSLIDHASDIFPGRFHVPESLIAGLVDMEDVEWLHNETGIDFRLSEGERPVFSEVDLDEYLSRLDDGTIKALREYLIKKCGVSNPPKEIRFLVARYFISFLKTGWPSWFRFDPDVYLDLNPDVKAAGVNPFQHYLTYGIFEGRQLY